ncbi:CLUMA_CG007596, isoform A [Clunio marinus]|uniref:CLUMA_CG007596, isoform A n=1 Tax=Clunio marinus TaxID=568069 RepID=A0A1J1I6N2_9DIPT|nr:CLUMA_CG007596, isoform A [Clunio marinus]
MSQKVPHVIDQEPFRVKAFYENLIRIQELALTRIKCGGFVHQTMNISQGLRLRRSLDSTLF